jgi:GDP-L-fucose synthase
MDPPPASSVYVAGAATAIGRAIVRRFQHDARVAVVDTRAEPPLTDPRAVDAFFAEHRPQWVIHAGGESGGIQLNSRHPAHLMVDNLLGTVHVLDSAHRHGTRKLLYLASSCAYPKHAIQPMAESMLLTGPLEPTSEPYAVAKIAGITLCRAYQREHGLQFFAGIPGDVFGPGDDFSPDRSHVVAGLIRRMHEARQSGARTFTVWGSGAPRRELIYVDDLADACVFVMERYEAADRINLGSGEEVTISDLARLVGSVVGLEADLTFDTSRPDGTSRKALDSTRLRGLGWRPRWRLREALTRTYEWFLAHDGHDAR